MRNRENEFPPTSGQLRSLPGRGGGEIALGFAMLERAKRASHIDSTSVTLRHHAEGVFPTAERTLDPARMFEESSTPTPGIRERPRPLCDIGAGGRPVEKVTQLS